MVVEQGDPMSYRFVGIVGAILLLAAIGAVAQESDPQEIEPTPTPTPVVEEPKADGVLTQDEIINSPELSDEEVADALLNRYPEAADKSFKEKVGLFGDAVRGLLVWDFFDGKVTVRGHMRIQADGTFAKGNSTFDEYHDELDNGVDLRRLQFFAQGTIDDHLRYSASFNFGVDTGFGEVFVEGRHEGLRVFGYNVGQFRLGFFQEPFGFERVMSSYYTGFVERSSFFFAAQDVALRR